jgi:hypothetical protein
MLSRCLSERSVAKYRGVPNDEFSYCWAESGIKLLYPGGESLRRDAAPTVEVHCDPLKDRPFWRGSAGDEFESTIEPWVELLQFRADLASHRYMNRSSYREAISSWIDR